MPKVTRHSVTRGQELQSWTPAAPPRTCIKSSSSSPTKAASLRSQSFCRPKAPRPAKWAQSGRRGRRQDPRHHRRRDGGGRGPAAGRGRDPYGPPRGVRLRFAGRCAGRQRSDLRRTGPRSDRSDGHATPRGLRRRSGRWATPGTRPVADGDPRRAGTPCHGSVPGRTRAASRNPDSPVPTALRAVLQREQPELWVPETQPPNERLEILVEPLLPKPLLVIVGGGHIGQAVAVQANLVGFEIVVIDDRPEFASRRAVSRERDRAVRPDRRAKLAAFRSPPTRIWSSPRAATSTMPRRWPPACTGRPPTSA